MTAEDGSGTLQSCFCDTDEYERLTDRCCAVLGPAVYKNTLFYPSPHNKHIKKEQGVSPTVSKALHGPSYVFFTFLQQMEVEQWVGFRGEKGVGGRISHPISSFKHLARERTFHSHLAQMA